MIQIQVQLITYTSGVLDILLGLISGASQPSIFAQISTGNISAGHNIMFVWG